MTYTPHKENLLLWLTTAHSYIVYLNGPDMRNYFLLKGNIYTAITRNFLLEGARFGYDIKNGGWDILDVFPIRHFD